MADGEITGSLHPAAEGPLPNFVVVGTRKSATTTLWAQLRTHPDAFLSDRKEVQFFDKHWDEGLPWYRQHFAAVTTETAIGEVSPTYMCSPGWLDRLQATLPDARLIAVLRDPIDRLVSALSHRHRERGLDDVRAAVERDLAAAEPQCDGFLGAAHYADHLAWLRARFEPDQLLVLLYEDLTRDMSGTLDRVYRHIGVDPARRADDPERHENPAHDVRSWRLQRWLFTGFLPRRYPNLAGRVIVWNVIASTLELPADLRGRLVDHFAPHVTAVEEHLGRSLDDLWRTAAERRGSRPVAGAATG